jgi:hypothetical protein
LCRDVDCTVEGVDVAVEVLFEEDEEVSEREVVEEGLLLLEVDGEGLLDVVDVPITEAVTVAVRVPVGVGVSVAEAVTVAVLVAVGVGVSVVELVAVLVVVGVRVAEVVIDAVGLVFPVDEGLGNG